MAHLHKLAEGLPEFTDDPVQRLVHTIAAFGPDPEDEWAVVATSNAVPGHWRTGLTWDDMRSLLDELTAARRERGVPGW